MFTAIFFTKLQTEVAYTCIIKCRKKFCAPKLNSYIMLAVNHAIVEQDAKFVY